MPLNVGDARFGCYLGCGGARMGGDAARNARRAYLLILSRQKSGHSNSL